MYGIIITNETNRRTSYTKDLMDDVFTCWLHSDLACLVIPLHIKKAI
ncbi:MAG: hypothetical protein V4538_00460 [Bacteroidota bacterium]